MARLLKEIPQIQITPPEEISINENIRHFDYSNSHLIFNGIDLGSFKDIQQKLYEYDFFSSHYTYSNHIIYKFVHKCSFTKPEKKWLKNFKDDYK